MRNIKTYVDRISRHMLTKYNYVNRNKTGKFTHNIVFLAMMHFYYRNMQPSNYIKQLMLFLHKIAKISQISINILIQTLIHKTFYFLHFYQFSKYFSIYMKRKSQKIRNCLPCTLNE